MDSKELSDELDSSFHEGEVIEATIKLQQNPPQDPRERKRCRIILQKQAKKTTSEYTEVVLERARKKLK